MIKLFVLIVFCFAVANQIEVLSKGSNSTWEAAKKNWVIKILFFVLSVALVLFSGLRTSYNDTRTYMHGYTLIDIADIDWSMLTESYGGFYLFESVLKKYVSIDPQTLIMTSSIIVNVLYVWFFAKRSKCFGLTILSYFILGPYIFSMAGIKQILAMSISLLAIDNMLERKYGRFVIWLLIATTFHPYIICLFVLPFLMDSIWNKKIILLVLVMMLCVGNVGLLLKVASSIGKDYTMDELTQSTINPIRVIIEMIPVAFSFICRNKIREYNNKFLNLGVNMVVLNGFMIFAGLFMSPIYCGRIATYFSMIVAITIPWMLNVIYRHNVMRRQNIIIYYTVFITYFVLDLTKLGSVSVFKDIFKHIKLF